MKTAGFLFSLGLLVSATPLLAQRFPTNSINTAQAIKLASRLRVGMREQDVAKVRDEQNGLKCGGDVGDSIGWTRFYLLADGCFLDLRMEPKEVLSLSFKFEGTNTVGGKQHVGRKWPAGIGLHPEQSGQDRYDHSYQRAPTKRFSEPEPAASLRNKSVISNGCLPPLSFTLTALGAGPFERRKLPVV
jgi:hypothetical protein